MRGFYPHLKRDAQSLHSPENAEILRHTASHGAIRS